MRIGFVTQLLWPRYGPFWRELVEAAGAEPTFPTLEGMQDALQDEAVSAVPITAFRLAAAQARSLAAQVDLLIAPRLNADVGVERGGAQDPFIFDFPGALALTVPGLPPIRAVPASLGAELEEGAIELLRSLLESPAHVSRVWARLRPRAKPPRYAPVKAALPGELKTVALLGQPWLLNDQLKAALTQPGEHLISQHELDPEPLMEEGLRGEPRLIRTDAEVIGAARMLGRRAGVTSIRYLYDPAAGADAWQARRVKRATNKPVELTPIPGSLAGEPDVATLSNLAGGG